MEKDGVARLDPVGRAEQVLDRHPLQHHAGRLCIADGVGELDQAMRRNDALLGISTGRQSGIGDPVADRYFADTGADSLDNPGSLHARCRRQVAERIEAGAVVHVDKVEADCRLLQFDFARSRRGHRNILPLHHFRSAGLVNSYCPGHFALPLSWQISVSKTYRVGPFRQEN